MAKSFTYTQISKVAYPIFLTLLVQNLIQVMATAFLGRVGEVELGASAIAGIYYIVIFMLAFGFSTGAQILIGRRNGEKNYHKIGELVIHGGAFLLLMALIMFLFTQIFAHSILSQLLSSPKVLDAALKYLDVRIYGIFFACLNSVFRAFYIGTTRTKILSYNALLMATVNIFLDYVLIFGHWGFPAWGISGAAVSAVASEFVSVLFFMAYTGLFIDLKQYGFSGIHFKNLQVIRDILKISSSLMLQFVLSLGTWMFFFLAIEHMGETPLAVSNIIRSLYIIVAIPVFALATTSNTLVSNAIGAGNQDDVIHLVWRIARIALGISLLFMFLVFLFPREALRVYTNDYRLIEAAMPSLWVILSVLPIISIGNIFFNAVSGTGNTRTALKIEVLTITVYIAYIWIVTSYFHAPLYVCWGSEMVYGFFIFVFSYTYMQRWRQRKIK